MRRSLQVLGFTQLSDYLDLIDRECWTKEVPAENRPAIVRYELGQRQEAPCLHSDQFKGGAQSVAESHDSYIPVWPKGV